MTQLTTATYDIKIDNGKPTVTRNLVFKNGDTLSFSITLESEHSGNLVDLHRASAQAAIKYLEDWLKPE